MHDLQPDSWAHRTRSWFAASLHPWRQARFSWRVVGLAFLIGVGTVVTLIVGWWPAASTLRYRRTQGTVLAAHVQTLRVGTAYRPVVHYRYVVGGLEYTGRTYTVLPMGSGRGTKEWAERVICDYPLGGLCAVHYDPEDPADSVLRWKPDLDLVLDNIAFLLMGCAAVSLPGCPLWVRARHRLSNPTEGGRLVVKFGIVPVVLCVVALVSSSGVFGLGLWTGLGYVRGAKGSFESTFAWCWTVMAMLALAFVLWLLVRGIRHVDGHVWTVAPHGLCWRYRKQSYTVPWADVEAVKLLDDLAQGMPAVRLRKPGALQSMLLSHEGAVSELSAALRRLGQLVRGNSSGDATGEMLRVRTAGPAGVLDRRQCGYDIGFLWLGLPTQPARFVAALQRHKEQYGSKRSSAIS